MDIEKAKDRIYSRMIPPFKDPLKPDYASYSLIERDSDKIDYKYLDVIHEPFDSMNQSIIHKALLELKNEGLVRCIQKEPYPLDDEEDEVDYIQMCYKWKALTPHEIAKRKLTNNS